MLMSGGTAAKQLLYLIFWGLLGGEDVSGVEPAAGKAEQSSTAVLHLPCWAALSTQLSLRMVQRNGLQWCLLVHIPWQQSKISPLLVKCSSTAGTVQEGLWVQSLLPQQWWRVKHTVQGHKASLWAQIPNLWADANRHTCKRLKE